MSSYLDRTITGSLPTFSWPDPVSASGGNPDAADGTVAPVVSSGVGAGLWGHLRLGDRTSGRRADRAVARGGGTGGLRAGREEPDAGQSGRRHCRPAPP